jgi:hypothetical protein
MTNVVVAKKRIINVSVNTTAGIIDTSPPVTLKNVPVLTTNFNNRLDSLNDVYANNEINGATLVYDSSTDLYKVEKLNIENVVGAINGGEF